MNLKYVAAAMILVAALIFVAGCVDEGQTIATPTPTEIPTQAATPTLTESPTAETTKTPTPKPTPKTYQIGEIVKLNINDSPVEIQVIGCIITSEHMERQSSSTYGTRYRFGEDLWYNDIAPESIGDDQRYIVLTMKITGIVDETGYFDMSQKLDSEMFKVYQGDAVYSLYERSYPLFVSEYGNKQYLLFIGERGTGHRLGIIQDGEPVAYVRLSNTQ